MALPFRLICASIFSLLLLSCSLSRPEAPATIVCLTFDDGHRSVYEHAMPILHCHGLRATSFVNSGLVGSDQIMNWDQIISLDHDYGWETGGHGLDHINLAELDYEAAAYQISDDRRLLTEHGLVPLSFALPYGVAPLDYYELISSHYANIRGSNDIPMHHPVDRLNLGYLPYQSGWTADQLKARILQGMANQEALVIIGFHRVETPNASYYDNCPASVLEEFCAWLAETGLRVMTVSEAMAEL